MELRRLKWLKKAAWAVGVIKKYFLGWQVRREVREMKRRQREREAVLVIQKYCRGWKVFTHYNLIRHRICGIMYVILHNTGEEGGTKTFQAGCWS